MRWMVYFLLAANLGLLTWNLQTHGAVQPAKPVRAPHPAAPGPASQLPLLAEVGVGTLRPRAAAGEAGGRADGQDRDAATDIYNFVGRTQTGSTPPSGTDPGNCLTVGPLAEDAPVHAIRDWVQALGAEADVRSDERREVALYWIYLPPQATREAAIEVVAGLRGKGISDVIVVPKGDMANAISLGVFSRPETRDRRLRELSEKGYQPSIAPRYRSKLATWIDVAAGDGAAVRDGLVERWPDLQLTDHACSGEQIAGGGPGFYNPGTEPPPSAPGGVQYASPDAGPRAGPDR
jgi:hypothetical protein